MNRRLARALVRLYPTAWRRRYGAEFASLLEDGPGGLGAALNVVASALGERIFPPTRGGERVGTRHGRTGASGRPGRCSGWRRW